jgi:hypothetical protein
MDQNFKSYVVKDGCKGRKLKEIYTLGEITLIDKISQLHRNGSPLVFNLRCDVYIRKQLDGFKLLTLDIHS